MNMKRTIAIFTLLVISVVSVFSLDNGKFQSDGTSFTLGTIHPADYIYTIYLIEDKIILVDNKTQDMYGWKTLEVDGERRFAIGDIYNNSFSYSEATDKYILMCWVPSFEEYDVLIFDRVE